MKKQLKTTPEVSVTSPDSAPAGGNISAEIPAAIVSTETAPVLPFGVYLGTPVVSPAASATA